MKTLITAIAFFSFVANVFAVDCSDEPYKMALSEIQMLPANTNDPVRIELVNRSGERVNMTGWYMTDGYGHRYDFPKSLTVPKGALVVVAFGSKQMKDKNDLDFSDHVAYLYCTESWADKAFRGRKNECAVYAPADGEKAGNIHDYILWGSRSREEILARTDAFKLAVEKKLWHEEDAAITPDENSIGGRHIQPGESLARIDFQRQWMMSNAWFINALYDVSFGVTNSWPVPRPMYPRNKDRFELKNPEGFSWDATCGTNDTFLIQISRNKDFTDILLEKVTPSQSIRHTLEEGTYYWRVCINASEANRKWSKISEFTVVDMSKHRPWQPGDPPIKFKGKKDENKKHK